MWGGQAAAAQSYDGENKRKARVTAVMTVWPEDQASSVTVHKPPSYWLGFALNLFFAGAGFAFIHRPWPTLLIFLVGHFLSGPFAFMMLGPDFYRWSFNFWLLVIVVSLVWYRNTYRAQHVERTVTPPRLSWPLRLIGIWLSVLSYVVIQMGYTQGWLPRPGL